MVKNPFGKRGDFITAPNISILFSEMIAIWVISFWEKLDCPKQFNLIELGAGNGEMMKVLVKTFSKFSQFKKSCKINLIICDAPINLLVFLLPANPIRKLNYFKCK